MYATNNCRTCLEACWIHWVQVVLYKLVLCISLTNENLSEEPLMCQLHKRAGTYTYVYIYSQICHIYVYVYICVWMLFHNWTALLDVFCLTLIWSSCCWGSPMVYILWWPLCIYSFLDGWLWHRLPPGESSGSGQLLSSTTVVQIFCIVRKQPESFLRQRSVMFCDGQDLTWIQLSCISRAEDQTEGTMPQEASGSADSGSRGLESITRDETQRLVMSLVPDFRLYSTAKDLQPIIKIDNSIDDYVSLSNDFLSLKKEGPHIQCVVTPSPFTWCDEKTLKLKLNVCS